MEQKFPSKKQKILRLISTSLLLILILMLIGGFLWIDSNEQPVLYVYYYAGAMTLTMVILLVTGIDIWEIRKNLRHSLERDQELLTDLLKTAIKIEKEQKSNQDQPYDPNYN